MIKGRKPAPHEAARARTGPSPARFTHGVGVRRTVVIRAQSVERLSSMPTLPVTLDDTLCAFIDREVQSGVYASPDDLIADAIDQLRRKAEYRDDQRQAFKEAFALIHKEA